MPCLDDGWERCSDMSTYRHPGSGSLLDAAARVAEDAHAGCLGRLTPAMAIELIINRRQPFCVGGVGWSWAGTEIDPNYGDPIACLYVATGGPDVAGYRDRVYCAKWAGRGHRYVRFNAAQWELDGMGTESFLPVDDDTNRLKHDIDIALWYGLVPGQQALIRGSAWSHYDSYNGEHDSGYDTEVIYIEPAEAPVHALADFLEMFERRPGGLIELAAGRGSGLPGSQRCGAGDR